MVTESAKSKVNFELVKMSRQFEGEAQTQQCRFFFLIGYIFFCVWTELHFYFHTLIYRCLVGLAIGFRYVNRTFAMQWFG